MTNTNSAAKTKRQYKRRTDQERILDLQRRIEELKVKQATKKGKEDPLLREIPKIQRRLRKFAQFAMDHKRADIANSTTAFVAGLEHMLRSALGASSNRPRFEDVPEEQG